MIAGKPLLTYPLGNDQHFNAAVIHREQVGLPMGKLGDTNTTLAALTTLMNNWDEYSERIRLKWRQQQMAGGAPRAIEILMDTAIVGTVDHFMPKTAHLPLLVQLGADVFACCALVVLLIGLGSVMCLRCCCRRLCCKNAKRKAD
eukprot:TRINITY_DN63625_c0_g1_i3.p1 TRINITY_DN63625_c0_g1~~TRINITY_DN63625_c0_g1_i3.p1  ORF type:complete len:145 (+),score=7.82 TRINITY_DN63625_c0_g1_i3:210-644(+)